jgi:hypothetical protein
VGLLSALSVGGSLMPPVPRRGASLVVDRFNGSNCVPFAWTVRPRRATAEVLRMVSAALAGAELPETGRLTGFTAKCDNTS